MRLYGGAVRMNTQRRTQDQGTCVTHTSPEARPQSTPTQGRSPGPASAPATRPDRLRVLLVEDDEQDAFLVRELLAEVGAPVDLIVARTLAEVSTLAKPGVSTAELDALAEQTIRDGVAYRDAQIRRITGAEMPE